MHVQIVTCMCADILIIMNTVDPGKIVDTIGTMDYMYMR